MQNVIKGIDAQIMIQRSVDSSRHASEQANNLGQTQDFINRLEKERLTQSTKSGTQASETEGSRIEREKRSREQQGEEKNAEGREQAQEQPREILDDVSKLSVGYGPVNRIDIEV